MNGLYVALVIAAGLLSIAASVMAILLMIDNRNQRRTLREYVNKRANGLHERVTRLEERAKREAASGKQKFRGSNYPR